MNQADFVRTFNLPFNEASTWFRDKLNIPTVGPGAAQKLAERFGTQVEPSAMSDAIEKALSA